MTPKQKLIGALVLMCLNVAISGPEGKTMTEPAVIEAVENKPLEFVPFAIEDIVFSDLAYPDNPQSSQLQFKEKGQKDKYSTSYPGKIGQYRIAIEITINPQYFNIDRNKYEPVNEVVQGQIELWSQSGTLLKTVLLGHAGNVVIFYPQHQFISIVEDLSPIKHGDYVLKFKLRLNKKYIDEYLSISTYLRHSFISYSADFKL